MSTAGNIYFFACHMLYTVMQIYYEFQEQESLEMNRLAEKYSKWISVYEEIMGWSLEELVFPFEWERIASDLAKTMGEFAEERDEMLYRHIFSTIKSTTERAKDKYPSFDLNVLIYLYYCTFLANALQQYDTILNMNYFVESEYLQHYQLEIEVFKRLIIMLKDQHFPPIDRAQDDLADIEIKAEQWGAEWNRSVFAAVHGFGS